MNPTRHAAFVLAYDQVDAQYQLTVQTVETVLAQDIGPLDLVLIDNGSTQRQTWDHFEMLRHLYLDREDETRIHTLPMRHNVAPVKIVNRVLAYLFALGHDKVLGCPNDVMLPPSFYRKLNEWPRGMVTASEIKDVNAYRDYMQTWNGEVKAASENTPMATTLVRKWFYDALIARDGMFFDENIFSYTSDCDLALRMASCGIHGIQLDLPYWHFSSACWKLLPAEDGRKITDQADVDRAYFQRKWGFACTAYEYGASAQDINFRGKAATA